MSDYYLGEIRLFPYTFVPLNWHACDGTLLPIQQYSALFSLLGTYYGGNGTSNFGLPDLRSRAAVGVGQGVGLSNYTLGQQAGAENVALAATQIPAHNHAIAVNTAAAGAASPQGAFLAEPVYIDSSRVSHPVNGYAAAATDGKTLAAGAVLNNTGGGQSHDNIQPVQALQYCIAMAGEYPSRG